MEAKMDEVEKFESEERASSGNKNDLLTEIYKEIIPPHPAEITEKLKRRGKGKKQPLIGLKHELEVIFGLRRRNRPEDGLSGIQNIQKSADMDLTPCLLKPGGNLLVNLEVCHWCTHRQGCQNSETNLTRQIEYVYSSKHPKRKGVKEDAILIKKCIQNEVLVIQSTVAGMIHTNKVDLFRPGFGGKNERRVHIMPLSEVRNTANKQSWSHLFQSEYLGRTLTVLEACLLNFLPMKHNIRLDVFEDHENGFRTVKEVKDVFIELNIEKGNNKIVFNNKMNNSDVMEIFRRGLENNINQDIFYHNLVRHSDKFFPSGLHGTEELFSNNSEEMDFKTRLLEFLWEVWNSVKDLNNEDVMLEDPYFGKRPPGIILHGKGTKINDLPFQYQLIRIKEVPGLKIPWLIFDSTEYPKQIRRLRRPLTQKIDSTWLEPHQNPPQELENLLRRSHHFRIIGGRVQARYDLRNWELPPRPSEQQVPDGTTETLYFPPKDIFSACALTKQLQNVKNSLGNPGGKILFLRLQSIFDSLFLSMNPTVTLSELTDTGFKQDLLEELHKPSHRRSLPSACVLSISKDKRFNKYLRFQSDPNQTDDSDNTITEQITIFTQNRSDFQDEHIVENTTLQVLFEMRRVAKVSTRDNDIFDTVFDNWKEHRPHTNERSKKMHGAEVEAFLEIMNYSDKTVSNELISRRYLWISTLTYHEFENPTIDIDCLAQGIKNHLNHVGQDGVVMVARSHEIPYIESLIGKVEYRVIQLDKKMKHEFVYWVTAAPLGVHSPNFLTVGSFDEF
ncbi:hypothetical protein OAV04_00540 [Candidatus Poseidoniaceae archaeon]|nr:hypothetical protein [Candidatus Poseidoniaceae archaeon]